MGMQLTLPYTIAVYMVRNIYKGEEHAEQKIAQLTGILAGSQSFVRCLAAYTLGIITDKVGRKVGVLAGIIAASTSLLLFGSSTSYVGALLSRALPAIAVSGVPIALSTMVGDVCNQKQQAYAMGIFNLGWGLGNVVGPLLGGLLAQPCEQYSQMPLCRHGQLFEKRPFFLPCATAASIGVVALIISCILMEETHPELSKESGLWIRNLCHVITFRGSVKQRDYIAIKEEESHVQNGAIDEAHLADFKLHKNQSDIEMGPVNTKENAGKGTQAAAEDSEVAKLIPTSNSIRDGTSTKWWTDKDICYTLAGSGLSAFFFNYFDEMAPIYVSAPVSEGGLAMPLSQFTYPLVTAGALLMVFSLIGFPWLVSKYSPLTLGKYGMILISPMVIMLPLASVIRGSAIAQQVLLYLSIVLAMFPKTCAMNAAQMAMNAVVPSRLRGRVIGAAWTLQSGGRALGPTLSGTTWAVSVSLHVYGQQFLGFIVCMLGCIASSLVFTKINLPSNS